PLVHKREIEREKQRGPRDGVPDTEPTPEKRRENDRDELDPDSERKGERCGYTPPAPERPRRDDDRERAEEIDVAVARAFDGDERVPRVREAPPQAPARGGEEAQEDEDHQRVAKRERRLHRARGLLDRRHDAEEELRARGIGARNPTVVELACDGRVESRRGRIVVDEPVGILAEALEPAIPDVAVDGGGELRRLNMQRHTPERAEDKAEREATVLPFAEAPEEADRDKVTAAGDDRPDNEEDRPPAHIDEGERDHGNRDHAA